MRRWLAWWQSSCRQLADQNRIKAAMVPKRWHHLIAEDARAVGMNQFTVPPMPKSYEWDVAIYELRAALWDALGGKTGDGA